MGIINCSQIQECGNWDQGGAVSFVGIYVSNFRYSVAPTPQFSTGQVPVIEQALHFGTGNRTDASLQHRMQNLVPHFSAR